jgi:hypothetical protein
VLNPSGTGKVVLDSDTVLGGNLDVSTNKIVTTANNNDIELDPHGTGKILLNANVKLGGTLDTNGFDIVSSSNRNIRLTPHGSGLINLNGPIILGGDINVDGKKILSTQNGDIQIEPHGSGLIRLSGSVSVQDGFNILLGTTTGTRIGTATNQRLAFYGVAPVPQPASAAQRAVVDNTNGDTSALTLERVQDTSAGDESTTINNNFARIAVLLNRLRADLVSLGLIKGNA